MDGLISGGLKSGILRYKNQGLFRILKDRRWESQSHNGVWAKISKHQEVVTTNICDEVTINLDN